MPDGRIREDHGTSAINQQWQRLDPGYPTLIASRMVNARQVITVDGNNLAASPPLHLAREDIEGANLWSLEEAGTDADGVQLHYIQSHGTEYVWEAPAENEDPGAAILLRQNTGNDNQRWRERNTHVDAFILRNAESNQVIDVPGFASGPTTVQQFTRRDGYNQMWEIVDAAEGRKKIVSVSNGLYLNEIFIPIPPFTGVKSYGIPVLGPEDRNSTAQEWEMEVITESPTGDIVTFENEATGNFLSIYKGQQNGTVFCLPESGGPNQQWKTIF